MILVIFMCLAIHAQLLPYQQQVENIKQRLVEKYCPFYDFHGKGSCPTSPALISSRPSSSSSPNKTMEWHLVKHKNHINLLGGLGFNKASRTLAFPILKTNNVTNMTSVENRVLKFTNINEFLGALDRNEILGGILGEDQAWLSNFALVFGDYMGDIFITQKEYYTHKVLASSDYTDEFKEFLTLLPSVFDSKNTSHTFLYKLFFDLFGTGVAQETHYGGLAYMQTAVKKCYGGSVNEDTIKELQSNIHKESPGSLAYLRFRRLGVQDIRGGNPELDMLARINTFKDAPAILNFKYTSIIQVVPLALQVSVQEALNWYMGNTPSWQQEVQNRVQVQRINQYKAAKFIRMFYIGSTFYTGGWHDEDFRGACGQCITGPHGT
jgi:hypothetical protein